MNDFSLPDRQSTRTSRRHLHTMAGLLVAGGLLRLALLLLTPLYPESGLLPGYNDEPHHHQYVRHLAEGGGWPVFSLELAESDTLSHEYSQTPLYYALAAPVWRTFDALGGWGLFGARAVSITFGLLAALFTYRTALLWNGDRKTAVGALTVMLFAPASALFSSIVTNDALLMLMAAMALHSLMLTRSQSSGLVRQVMTGALLAGAVWAKMSGLVLLPLFLFAGKPSSSHLQRWLGRGRVLLVAMLLLFPLAAWNISNYGSPLGPGLEALPPQYAPEQAVGVSGGAVSYPVMALKLWLRTAAQPMIDAWGSGLERFSSAAWLLVWGGVTLMGLAMTPFDRPPGYLFLAAFALMCAAFTVWGVHMFQVEFRLFAPVFPALAILTARASAALRIAPAAQAFLWSAPMIVLFVSA